MKYFHPRSRLSLAILYRKSTVDHRQPICHRAREHRLIAYTHLVARPHTAKTRTVATLDTDLPNRLIICQLNHNVWHFLERAKPVFRLSLETVHMPCKVILIYTGPSETEHPTIMHVFALTSAEKKARLASFEHEFVYFSMCRLTLSLAGRGCSAWC